MEELAKFQFMNINKIDMTNEEFLYEGGDTASQMGGFKCFNAKGETVIDGK